MIHIINLILFFWKCCNRIENSDVKRNQHCVTTWLDCLRKNLWLQFFRESHEGGALPSARSLSNSLNDDNPVVSSRKMTAMHVHFGQYVAHDITRTLFKQGEHDRCAMLVRYSQQRANCFSCLSIYFTRKLKLSFYNQMCKIFSRERVTFGVWASSNYILYQLLCNSEKLHTV